MSSCINAHANTPLPSPALLCLSACVAGSFGGLGAGTRHTSGLFWNLVNYNEQPWLELAPTGISIPNVFGISNSPSGNGEYFLYIHYFSKAVDYFDTLFIVLKKKDRQFSFLHLWHHSTIGPIWGFLLFNRIHGGTVCFGALLNSWIHVLMYSHYLVTALGFTNPFKKLLTTCQITQFYACFSHSIIGLFYEQVFPRSLAWLQFFYQLSMLVLFTSFSNRTYAAKPADKKAEGESAATVDSPSPAKGPVTRRRAKMKATTD